MDLEVQKTADGSDTVLNKSIGVHYHSTNGAITEAEHVFISAGLNHFSQSDIAILEVGLGTGLNAALTAMHAGEKGLKVSYIGLELYPLNSDCWQNRIPKAAAPCCCNSVECNKQCAMERRVCLRFKFYHD